MKRWSLASLCVVVLATGCKKEQPSAEAVPPSVAANADNSIRENVTGEEDAFLTTQLRTYLEKKGKMPATFTEFRRDALDSMPQPPAGKKWVIDRASRSVKAVAQ